MVSFLDVGVQDLHSVIHSLVTEGIAKSLDSHVPLGTCIGYTFSNGNQSNILTVQSAIDDGGFDFWYLTIQIDMQPGTILEETSVLPPKVMEWIPIRYAGGIEKQFKFKHTEMKTRERYIIELLHPLVPATLFTHVPAILNCKRAVQLSTYHLFRLECMNGGSLFSASYVAKHTFVNVSKMQLRNIP